MQDCKKKCCCRNWVAIISGLLFAAIAIMHLLRATMGWSMTCHGEEVPMWASWVVFAVGAVVALMNFCACRCKKCNECNRACCTKNPQA